MRACVRACIQTSQIDRLDPRTGERERARTHIILGDRLTFVLLQFVRFFRDCHCFAPHLNLADDTAHAIYARVTERYGPVVR